VRRYVEQCLSLCISVGIPIICVRREGIGPVTRRLPQSLVQPVLHVLNFLSSTGMSWDNADSPVQLVVSLLNDAPVVFFMYRSSSPLRRSSATRTATTNEGATSLFPRLFWVLEETTVRAPAHGAHEFRYVLQLVCWFDVYSLCVSSRARGVATQTMFLGCLISGRCQYLIITTRNEDRTVHACEHRLQRVVKVKYFCS